jgi:outer membrane protein TolC
MINAIRGDVRNALIGVQQASASYQAAVKARVLQEQKLSAEQKKYALGASTNFLVIQYQRDLALAQSNEVAAQSAYAKTKVQLDATTGDTLDRYNISIDEAIKGKVSRAPSALPVAAK